ncbi:formate dehydrogenase major subunit [Anoxynatronum buryatiense]|nr:twin-arginine translocation signal domain-containing protein [Anoxynatronum buryatiense]SMP44900.1 formate dehydrogenase major subunit [Anoxynatronum buryatiense]
MEVTRRQFLKVSGTAAAATTLYGIGFREVAHGTYRRFRLHYAHEVTTICPFCSVGCGIICHVREGQVVNTEGDPDHPINEGALCSKGSSLLNMAYVYDEKGKPVPNPSRVTQVLYRRPGGADWETVDWDWALRTIAARIKKTRDDTFITQNSQGVPVNRTPAIAWLGSAMCNNEENYLFHKMTRSLGLVNIDHCARL